MTTISSAPSFFGGGLDRCTRRRSELKAPNSSTDAYFRSWRSLKEHWADGVRTHLGLASAGFPNLMIVYGPQSPAGFCNGPSAAELQGDVIVQCLAWLRDQGHTRIEATAEAEAAWNAHIEAIASVTLFTRADSWYMGANIPGKPRQLLNYAGGLPLYLQRCAECADAGYSGFELRGAEPVG